MQRLLYVAYDDSNLVREGLANIGSHCKIIVERFNLNAFLEH